MMFRIVFWDVLPCKKRQYIPEDNSEHELKTSRGRHVSDFHSNKQGFQHRTVEAFTISNVTDFYVTNLSTLQIIIIIILIIIIIKYQYVGGELACMGEIVDICGWSSCWKL
jgi:hypothetical protein